MSFIFIEATSVWASAFMKFSNFFRQYITISIQWFFVSNIQYLNDKFAQKDVIQSALLKIWKKVVATQ